MTMIQMRLEVEVVGSLKQTLLHRGRLFLWDSDFSQGTCMVWNAAANELMFSGGQVERSGVRWQ